MSFRSVVDTRLKGGVGIKKVQQIADLFNGQELWAYCVQFHFEDGTQVFTFTKISTGKVAIDPDPKTMVGKIQHPAKAVRAFFDTNSAKLELLKGESINLDKTIDCLLIGETFLVFSKTKFEWIVGLEAEFRIEACNVAEELCNCAFIEGANLIKDEIESNPSIHKRLAKLSKLGQHKNLDSDRVRAMLDYSKEIGVELKADNGKIKIENKQDIDLLAKFLADYYKDSKITGNVYGTYAGNLVRKGAFS
jgi:hypothetical protein